MWRLLDATLPRPGLPPFDCWPALPRIHLLVFLHRVKGIGSEYADLLEAAGVDTVVELSKRVPANLLAKMEEANQAKELVRKLPTLKQVEDWVDQGKKLPRLLTY